MSWSGINPSPHADVHAGTDQAVVHARQNVLDAAYQTNPARFRHRRPTAPTPPAEAWINKPTIQTKTLNTPATTT